LLLVGGFGITVVGGVGDGVAGGVGGVVGTGVGTGGMVMIGGEVVGSVRSSVRHATPVPIFEGWHMQCG